MTQVNQSTTGFAYQAQTLEGRPMSGVIDAAGIDEATNLLQSLRLRVLQIEPSQRPARTKPLAGDDFLAFNQQLTHLTSAGLPIEHGLRLIAQDMRSGRVAETVRQVAEELDRGTPIGEAFDKHHTKFPPLYGRLVAAGVAANNLPGMLLNLGRHVELLARLRGILWRAASYPLMVLASLLIVVTFIGIFVLPKFNQLFRDFGLKLPVVTQVLLEVPRILPALLIAVACIVVGVPLLWMALRMRGWDRAFVDHVLLPMPLIGGVLRRNLVARWCDAVRLGISSGMDLPAAIDLAADAIGSPLLRHDGAELIAALQAGQPPDRVANARVLPATVSAAMALSTTQHDLPITLAALSEMYQQQAETRAGMIPGLLTPALVILCGFVIGFVILGLFLPLIGLLHSLTGGH